ncbi:hypothetical protein PFICI_00350 [Pestalotiopsis fici W106-1]|uniref:Ketoreductase domain-containing protein n=1 Tax=Pestalotiopsis fici (strain W106-1 / CGMCC3.15140) TaxID=1229662 RepID=W3XM11_PESFW|nr:uncharacterized protein PFICI_00350 [Pestalotiopsis fici W106-1]ETS86522.1 hypothetical protein PFICI_00350 [Pestalotiopsis fici W106-1]
MSHSYLITGASSGFGMHIAIKALKAGHKVVGTARNVESAAKRYPELEHTGGHWIKLDVTDPGTQDEVSQIVADHHVNVLINCAGYGILGSLEDMSEAEFQKQMDTNVTGTVRCIKGALPHFRSLQDKGGSTIVNVSSVAGYRGGASATAYAASKFAIEGLSEALAPEVGPFGIRVLSVAPGTFRTNFLTDFPRPDAGLGAAYADGPVAAALARFESMDGKQPGDPAKAADRIIELIDVNDMGAQFRERGHGTVFRVLLGKDCHAAVIAKSQQVQEDIESIREVALSTDF